MRHAYLRDDPDAAIRAALNGNSTGLIISTSGSTRFPHDVLLDTDCLRASAEACHARLSGPGRWLLALPPDRIAGAQVLIRSFIAGTTPVVLPPGRFDALAFAAGTAALVETTNPTLPLYTSLVPTQLHRLLATPAGTGALAAFAAVLVGGSPLGSLRVNASPIVETYGATETAGGCVYNGIPLKGVEVEIDAAGRICVGGAVVADGYADGEDEDFFVRDGVRWFRTSDLGTWKDGSLQVLGRADDVINSGGYKIHPALVERAMLSLPGVVQVVVVGVPDPEWVERIVALVVYAEGTPIPVTEEIRKILSADLPHFALPQEVRAVDRLPLLESGKIDRESARKGA